MILGDQTPRVLWRPRFTTSIGLELADWSASLGMIMEPWQRSCLEVACARRAAQWAAADYTLLLSRQNGKGALMEVRGLGGLFLLKEQTILYSCHEFKTAEVYFGRIRSWIDNTDDMRKRVKSMPAAHGQEAIKLTNGAQLKIIARTRSSGRGFSPQTLLFDEAQDLPRLALRSQMYAQGAQRDPQRWYAGTSPEPDAGEEAGVFLDRIEAGRAGGDQRAAYMEWSATDQWPESEQRQQEIVADKAGWARANPSLGYGRMTEDTIAGELSTAGTDYAGFGRERLSICSPKRRNTLIPVAAVNAALDETSAAVGRLVCAIDMPPDRSQTSLGVAGVRPDGRHHVELIKQDAGSVWPVAAVQALFARHGKMRVVIDKASAASSLLGAFAAAGIAVDTTTTQQYCQACGDMYDALTKAHTVLYRGEEGLADAMGSAGKRAVGDAWAFDRKGVADISPLVSVTLARWGLINLPALTTVYEERGLRVLD